MIEFTKYIDKFFGVEELSIVIYLMIFIGCVRFCFWRGEKYNALLKRAYSKNKKGEKLTTKEKKVLDEYEIFKKNMFDSCEDEK